VNALVAQALAYAFLIGLGVLLWTSDAFAHALLDGSRAMRRRDGQPSPAEWRHMRYTLRFPAAVMILVGLALLVQEVAAAHRL
jgi:hypothetical protein